MLKFKKQIRKYVGDHEALATVKSKAKERFEVLLARLHELEALTWREQTRGPTASRSWSIGPVDDPVSYPH